MDGTGKSLSPSAVAVQVGNFWPRNIPTWIWRMPLKPLGGRCRRQVGTFGPETSPPGPRLRNCGLPSILEAKSWTGRTNLPRRPPSLSRQGTFGPETSARTLVTTARHPSWRLNHGRDGQKQRPVHKRPHIVDEPSQPKQKNQNGKNCQDEKRLPKWKEIA